MIYYFHSTEKDDFINSAFSFLCRSAIQAMDLLDLRGLVQISSTDSLFTCTVHLIGSNTATNTEIPTSAPQTSPTTSGSVVLIASLYCISRITRAISPRYINLTSKP